MTETPSSIRWKPEAPGRHCVHPNKDGSACKSKGPYWKDADNQVRCRAHSTSTEPRLARNNFANAGRLEAEKQKGMSWKSRTKRTPRENPNHPLPGDQKVVSLQEAAARAKQRWPKKPNLRSTAGVQECIEAVAQNLADGTWDDKRAGAMNNVLKTALSSIDRRHEHLESPSEGILLEILEKL